MASQQLLTAQEPANIRLWGHSDINDQDSDFYVHPHLAPDHDPHKGRLLRASKPIAASSVLLIDSPYAIVPTVDPHRKEALICSNLTCSRRVSRHGQSKRCSNNCSNEVIWCNDACRSVDEARHAHECAWLKQKEGIILRQEGQYDFVTLWHVVRILSAANLELRSRTKPRKYSWEATFERNWTSMESCCAFLDAWPEAQVQHWKRLADTYLSDSSLLPCSLNSRELLLLLCREETNTFGLYSQATGPLYPTKDGPPRTSRGDSYGIGIYPRAAMFNHSCSPNVSSDQNDQILINPKSCL